MKKYILMLLAGILAGCNHPADKQFRVNGSFPEPFTGTVYLGKVIDKYTLVDSLKIEAQTTFTLQHKINIADNYQLSTRPFITSCSFIAQPGGTYNIDFHAPYEACSIHTEDAPEQELMSQFKALVSPLNNESQQLSVQYAKAQEDKDSHLLKQIADKLSDCLEQEQNLQMDFIREHHKSFAAIELSSRLFTTNYPAMKQIYDLLDTLTYRDTYAFRSFRKKLSKAESLWVEGRPAPDFTATDIHGKPVTLSQFKGKYVLLDFWASWCQPCRMKAKDIKKVYPELQKRGIIMLGICMDEHRKSWEKATQEDQITWTNTCQLQPFDQHSIAPMYKVQQLPSLFLISPEGTIMKQNPDIDYLMSLPQQ